MFNQDLKDIQVMRTPQHKRVKLLIISVVSLLGLVIVVFIINKNKMPNEGPTVAIYSEPTPIVDRTSIPTMETYDSNGITFNHPTDYKIEEKEKYLFLLSKSKDADITIDARKEGNNTNYELAVQKAKENLSEINQGEIPNGTKMYGIVKSGNYKGKGRLIAIIKTGTGAITVESTKDISEGSFDQVARTIVIK